MGGDAPPTRTIQTENGKSLSEPNARANRNASQCRRETDGRSAGSGSRASLRSVIIQAGIVFRSADEVAAEIIPHGGLVRGDLINPLPVPMKVRHWRKL